MKSINMWYLLPQCNERDIRKHGGIPNKYFKSVDIQNITEKKDADKRRKSDKVLNMCCIQSNSDKLWTIPSNRKKGPSFMTI